MSSRSKIRKRERQKRKYAFRPKSADKSVVSTRGLIADLARPLSSRAFGEAVQETQNT